MKTVSALSPLLLLAGCGDAAPDPAPAPSVLVGLQKVERGSAPEWLTAYGSAAPSGNGSETISVPQPGQVSRLAVTPGATVRAGQALVVFATAPSSVSAYQQATTALAVAEKQRATTAQLLTQQLATRDLLTQADKAVADARTALVALRQEGAGQASRTLVAPFGGVVTAVSVAQGDRTQPGAPLVTIARASSIIATAGVDPAEVARVRVGQAVRLERLSGGAFVSGRVIRVDGVLNPRTRLIDVGIAFPAGAMLPNEALRARIAVGQVAGWLVPHRAVVTANGAARVFQLAGSKARAIPVEMLLAGDTMDVVDGSLDARRRLIVDGAYQVEDGVVVRWVGR